DVGIAVSILAAAGTVPVAAVEGVTFLGELGLDGRLRPVRGVLPAVAGAAAAGVRQVAVPGGRGPGAAPVPGLAGLGGPAPPGALLGWRGGGGEMGQEATVVIAGEGAGVEPVRAGGRPAATGRPGAAGRLHPRDHADGVPGADGRPDLADVLGQPAARRAAEIC